MRPLSARHIRGDRAGRRLRGGIARQRAEHSRNIFGVAFRSLEAAEVDASRLVEIALGGDHRRRRLAVEKRRPAADYDPFDETAKIETGIGRPGLAACEKLSERDRAGGMSTLDERHRAQPQASDAQCPRVPRLIVGRHGGPGKDVSPRSAGVVVDIAAYLVPDALHQLPLIDKPRLLPARRSAGLSSPASRAPSRSRRTALWRL